MRTDVLIVGAGAAGLFSALHLPSGTDVVVVDKGRARMGSSPWAQGGVAAAIGPDDSPELHAQDTIRVSAGHADLSAVAVLTSEAAECVLELAELGCGFDRNDDGSLHLAREGGQTVARSVHAGDATGAAIMKTLRAAAAPRVRRIEGACLKLAIAEGRCVGGWITTDEGVVEVQASSTVLATGGTGALFEATTNPPGATGDGIVLAWDAGANLADLEFIQFHPTALAVGEGPQRSLVTEALRGAGAHVVDADGRRFLFEHHSDGELAPRDVVARAIAARRSWLDCRHIDRHVLETEFFTVMAACREAGLDLRADLIPIAPAAHYSIGGIATDLDGRTSIPRLYAIGECSNTGVHGANRLAGNSLAEALVFGRRAARAIAGQRVGRAKALPNPPSLHPAPNVLGEWSGLRSLCSKHLGIVREAGGLIQVRAQLEGLSLMHLSEDRAALELRSAAIAARLIAHGALLRRESRGVHYRADHPVVDPDWAGVRVHFYRAMGFTPLAYRGLETGSRDDVSWCVHQGDVRLVFTGALGPDSPIAEHVHKHGDGVHDIALRVPDAEEAYRVALSRGARSVAEPQAFEDEHGKVVRAAIATYGETIHSLISREEYSGAFLPGYQPAQGATPNPEYGVRYIDHVVGNVELGKMNEWVGFYERVMGFTELKHFTDDDISTEYSALMSKVVWDGEGKIKFPINEPAEGKRKSQIEEYLQFYQGPGVQHIALVTD
ncbi:MAG: L-aspartate oxidase, partial [Actinomycetota bacterium]|nr:L-aspartate oxidase [Actinomycetota bacterium]